MLNPLDDGCKDVVPGVKRPLSCILANHPSSWTAAAVVHAGDAEKSDELIQVGRFSSACKQAIVPFRCDEARNLLVLAPVICYYLTAGALKSVQRQWICLDAERIQVSRSRRVFLWGKRRRIPCWI